MQVLTTDAVLCVENFYLEVNMYVMLELSDSGAEWLRQRHRS